MPHPLPPYLSPLLANAGGGFHITPEELVIGMLVVLAGVALLAEKIKIAYPILLVLAGGVMGLLPRYVPAVQPIPVKPEMVFLVFLPPLLYYGALLTPWRDFKANFTQISGLAVGLVLATAAAVAVAAKFAFPGMSWGTAVLLGAIVSPPDAVAATAVLSKLKVPKRIVTILEGESLVNDATALVLYRVAIAAVIEGTFSAAGATWGVFVAAVGGIAIGLIAAWVIARILSLVEVPAVENVLALLVPYAAFLPADKLGVSGVLAAVAAGVYMGRQLPKIGSPQQRMRTLAVWDSLVFLLNGVIFILIGLQLYDVIDRGRAAMSTSTLLLGASLVSLAAILTRIVWVFPAVYLPPLFMRKEKRAHVPDWRETTIVSWAGMRGIVTLAAALAIPLYTDEPSKTLFPNRDLIIFTSFFMILVTLVGQGFTFAPMIKLFGLRFDDSEERKEETQARLDAAHAALSRLTVLGFDESINPEIINRVRAEYDERIIKLGGNPEDPTCAPNLDADKHLQLVRLEAVGAERKMITFMRDQNLVGDEVLRKILTEVDLEETKLRSTEAE